MALSYVFDPRKSNPLKPDFSFLASSLASRLVNPIWTFVVSSVSESEEEAVACESGPPAAAAVSAAAAAPSTLGIDALRRFRSRDIVKGWPNFAAIAN
jgi:hypothetical protein